MASDIGYIKAGVDDLKRESAEIDLFSGIVQSKDSEVADRIRALDINTMTPIEAISALYEYKKLLEK